MVHSVATRLSARGSRSASRPAGATLASLASLASLALLVSACGAEPTPAPATMTPVAVTTATPDPHLPDPTTADAVYRALRQAGFELVSNNATAGEEPRRTLNATYAGWPLIIREYSSSEARRATQPIPDGGPPGPNDAPYTFAGLNIVVDFGPHVRGPEEATPDPAALRAASALALALDRLLGPLEERSAIRFSPTPPPTPTPLPTPGGSPGTSPAASP